MSKVKLEELKEELKLAKEANELTASNIGKIVSEATSNIVKELKFDKDMISEVVKDVIDITTATLEEFGESTAQNIKVTSNSALDGVKNALKDEMDFHTKKFEELKHILGDESPETMKKVYDEIKKDTVKAMDNFKALGALPFDILMDIFDVTYDATKNALDKNKKDEKKK